MTSLLLTCLALAQSAQTHVASLGTEHLDEVAELRFTFNVEVGGELKASRAWAWRPADQRATLTSGEDTISFVPGKPTTEAEEQADAAFVNDLFWLMPQLHVHWAGPDLTVSYEGEAPLPVGEGTAELVVLEYAEDGGGYTPGDHYDLFVDADDKIVAWHYRKGGQAEPSLTASFEDYQQVGPLRIATEHRSPDGEFRLYFSDLAADLRARQ